MSGFKKWFLTILAIVTSVAGIFWPGLKAAVTAHPQIAIQTAALFTAIAHLSKSPLGHID
jgi:hypothetical protein